MKKRNYIGLATTPHDPAVALSNSEDDVVFAEGIERYLQDKRAWDAVPYNFSYISHILKNYSEANTDIVLSTAWLKKLS